MKSIEYVKVMIIGSVLLTMMVIQIPVYSQTQTSEPLAETLTTVGVGTNFTFRVERDPEIAFERIPTESSAWILGLFQDQQGFLWIATAGDGLKRYDGYQVRTYKHDPDNPDSLGDNGVAAICADHSGALWIALKGANGLDRFDPTTERFTHYRPDPQQPNHLRNGNLYTLYADRSGVIWIGSVGGGLQKYDPQTGEFSAYLPDPDHPGDIPRNSVQAIYEDRAGTIWLGIGAFSSGGNGLCQFDRATARFQCYRHDPANPQSLSHNEVTAIAEDRAGTLWVGTYGGGLNAFDRARQTFTHYRHDPADPESLGFDAIACIREDRAGALWIGTVYGLDVLDRTTGHFRHYRHNPKDAASVGQNFVWRLVEDRAGTLWVGTYAGTVQKIVRTIKPFHQHRIIADDARANGIAEGLNCAWAFHEDQAGALWIATSGGLVRYQRDAGAVTRYAIDPTKWIEASSVYEDTAGRLWVGSVYGLAQFDRRTGQFRIYRHDPDNSASLSDNLLTRGGGIVEDRQGVLWVGTRNAGVNACDPDTGQCRRYLHDPADPASLSYNTVTALHADASGVLWIATASGGLNRFDQTTGQFRRYLHDPAQPTSLSDNWVTALHEDRNGVLWLATSGGGLNRFDRATETFTAYRERDGLASDVVKSLLEDRAGNLWLSTAKGISRFTPSTRAFRNYDARDGIMIDLFNENAAYQTRRGELFFGGVNGFVSFFPEEITDNPDIPPVVITDFQIQNSPVTVGVWKNGRTILSKTITATDAITLNYSDKMVTFEFAALDFTVPAKNQYAYKLDGFDTDWNYIGNRRFATYTNLPGGTYTFRVKGSNNDGVWNEQGAVIAVTMTPPPWKTWWAYTLYGLSVIGMFLGYIRYKQAQYQRERKILDRFVPYEYMGFLGKKSILDVQLGDHVSSEMGVMFSDIRSFTTLSEGMTPKENFDFVNAYLRRVAPVIRGHHGFIVKFLGDGMMAVFPNGAEDGVNAAIDKLNQVKAYNRHRIEEGWKPIKIGIGVHAGHMMVGMVGEKARMQGDAFSDNVNLTARLEGLTKYYGVSFLITGETLKALSDPTRYHIRFLDNVAVKGKEKPIQIYEVYDADADDLFQKKAQITADFVEAQRLYFDRQFEAAVARFRQVLAVIPDDLTTLMYIERAEQFIKDGVPEDWQGVQKMDKK